MRDELEERFAQIAHSLLRFDQPLIVGLSGGRDSMALWALLKALPDWQGALVPVHVDHGLRPESAEEAAWLRQYVADRWAVPMAVVPVHALPRRGESGEMAARRARYRALLHQADQLGVDMPVVVAHQRNDQAETILMRLITGTGPTGLAGMSGLNGRIVRPLLSFWRSELTAYLERHGITWLDDPTNQDQTILRNRLRHRVLPLLRTINPAVDEALAGTADRMRDQAVLLEYLLDDWLMKEGVTLEGACLRLGPRWQSWPEALSREVLRRFGQNQGLRLGHRHLLGGVSQDMSWPEGFWVRHGQDGTLTVARAEPVPPRSEKRALRLLPEEGQFIWYGRSVTVQKGLFDGRWRPGWQAIDADRWPRLAVRGWEQGDRVHPLGMQGHSKKLQDIFVDKKIPRAERQAALVIVPANRPETILAVVGVVTDECARARPGEGVYWLRADETQWHGRG